MYRETLEQRLPAVRERIAEAARRSGRGPDEVRIVAVVKGHPHAAAEAAVEAGLKDLGENRVETLAERVRSVGRHVCRWHMVGHLQSRKARDVFGITDLLHSVDSVRLAGRLGRAATEAGERLPVLVQVNVAGEESKYGFSPGEGVEAVHQVADEGGLQVRGLMTMAPLTDDEGEVRRTFSGLREIREAARRATGLELPELSMGMSNDYEIAVEEGSTMVRLGTALLGERPG